MVPAASNDRVIIHESTRPLIHGRISRRWRQRGGQCFHMLSPVHRGTGGPGDEDRHGVAGPEHAAERQLPQKFLKADLEHAHEFARANKLVFTEDATLVAESGRHVEFIDGSDENFKVTTPVDVRLATFLMQETEVDDD